VVDQYPVLCSNRVDAIPLEKDIEMDGRERRLQPRVEVRWPVTLLTSEGSVQGETRDISMQGAFIYCDKSLPLSERFVLSVKAPAASMLLSQYFIPTPAKTVALLDTAAKRGRLSSAMRKVIVFLRLPLR
jgi:hypothetical protein